MLTHLRKRTEFVNVSQKGKRWVSPSHIIQILPKSDDPEVRFGITASRKVGGAVQRNFAKRRLRELIRELLPTHSMEGCDYVFIAKSSLVTTSFSDLRNHMEQGLRGLKRKLDKGQNQ